MNLGQKLNAPFPYYLNDDRKNTALCVAVGLFVFLFHLIYKTPGNYISLTYAQKALFGGITFAVMFVHIVLIPRVFIFSFLDAINWTVKKYIAHVLWICFVVACCNTTIEKLLICPDKSLAIIIPHVFQQIALTGIIPIAIMTLLFRNNLLQQNLKSAISTNQEISKIKDLKSEVSKTSNSSITIYSDTSETLTFKLPDLLFIEADDNYSTVVWKNGHGVEKKLLRINLKNIESQLNNTYAIRCHRSYIVNVHAITNVTGNTNGYKLQIRDSDFSIPVSRPKGKELMEKISELRNMMELY